MTRPYEGRHAPRVPALITDRRAVRIRTAQRIQNTYQGRKAPSSMSTWTEEMPAMMPSGIVGGDGAGESVSRRWTRRNDDGTWTVLNIYGYAVDGRERFALMRGAERPWIAETMTEAIICTDKEDPGSTEITSDYEYEESAIGYRTETGALAVASDSVQRYEPVG